MFSFMKSIPKPFRKCIELITNVVFLVIDYGMKLFGLLLSSAAVCLISFVSWVWFSEMIPLLMESYGFFGTQLLTIIGLLLVGNIFFNFFSTQWHGPGYSPPHLDDERKSLLVNDPRNRHGSTHRFCHDCNKVKPMRAHHCPICKKCVLKMDHHCPWVNTCVGWRNHKHFVLFLLYMWIGSSFFLGVRYDISYNILRGYSYYDTYLPMAFILCFSAFIAMTIFLTWSFFLVITNQTTLECCVRCVQKGEKRFNPFNQGLLGNCEEVFGNDGAVPILSWLMPSTSPPPGDGIIYSLRRSDGTIKLAYPRPKQLQSIDEIL